MSADPQISPFEMAIYRGLWVIAAPVVWAYFKLRARKDPDYGTHMQERFGNGPVLEGAIWVHATSLGEMISAAPVIKGLLAKGHHIVTTHHTPAGRKAAHKHFAEEISEGRVVVRYLPLEYRPALRRFLAACKPRLALVMEIDIWPLMLWEARTAGVPVWLCNTQFLTKSFERDYKKGRFRGRAVSLVAGAMTKSDLHTARFKEVGLSDVVTVGETRFEQAIPQAHLAAAVAYRPRFGDRPVIGIVNTLETEEAHYLPTIQRLRSNHAHPAFVVVPRAPERFAPMVAELSKMAGTTLARSAHLDQNLAPLDERKPDVLVGDSLGEMYFYLSLCDFVVMGGSFNWRGSHNVVEPLALEKPVIVGPHTWTIDYPVEEAIEAGAVTRVSGESALMPELLSTLDDPSRVESAAKAAKAFYTTQLGATDRILAKIDAVLADTKTGKGGLL